MEGKVDPADVYYDSQDDDYLSPDNNQDAEQRLSTLVSAYIVGGHFVWRYAAGLLVPFLLFGLLFISYHYDKVSKESYPNPYKPLIQEE